MSIVDLIVSESVCKIVLADGTKVDVNTSAGMPMVKGERVYVYNPEEGYDFYLSESDLAGAKLFKLTEVQPQ